MKFYTLQIKKMPIQNKLNGHFCDINSIIKYPTTLFASVKLYEIKKHLCCTYYTA